MKITCLLLFIICPYSVAQLRNLFNTFLNPQGSGVNINSFLSNGESLPAYQSLQRGRRGRQGRSRGISGIIDSFGGVNGIASGLATGLGGVASTLGLGGDGGGAKDLLETFGSVAQTGAIPQILGGIVSGGDIRELPLEPLHVPVTTRSRLENRIVSRPRFPFRGGQDQRGVDPDQLAEILGRDYPQPSPGYQEQLVQPRRLKFQPTSSQLPAYRAGVMPRRLGRFV